MFEEPKVYLKWTGKAVRGITKGTLNSIKREADLLKPRWILIMTTDLCNSRCTYCQIWENKKTHENLSPDEIKKILSDPVMKDVEYIINTGGEATTRTDIKEVLLAEHEVLPNAVLNLSTNALLPDRAYEAVKAVLEAGATVEATVSLDGIGSTHDELRGVKGNFEKVDYLINHYIELRSKHPKTLFLGIGSVLTDRTIPNLADVKKYCAERGIQHTIAWYNSTPFYNNAGTVQEHLKEETIKIVQGMTPDLITEKWVKWLNNEPIKFKCFSLFDFCVIKSNGDVTPCLTHWNVVAGNVRENSMSDIWTNKNPNMLEARKIVRNCSGCLNTWGGGWSWKTEQFPLISYFIRNPKVLKSRLKNEIKELNNRRKDKEGDFGDIPIGVG